MSSAQRYVIIGFGWVGQANALALRLMGYDVAYFDPIEQPRHYDAHANLYDSIKKLDDPLAADAQHTWYVVCVGDRVSEEGVQDISSIQKALESLSGAKGGVILRSTVLPDLLEPLKFDYYVPEFLHEKKAVEECVTPHFFVIGSKTNREEPSAFAKWRASTDKVFEGTPREASLIKYLSNLWNSLRIAFVNEFGNVIRNPESKKDVDDISKVLDFFFSGHSYLRYGRAFGGHCLPKDSRAFAWWYTKQGADVPLIAAMYESNTIHKNKQEKFPHLPEWFSQWEGHHISGWEALHEVGYAIKKHVKNPSLILRRGSKFRPH
jgi:nucleotide sugar dehydrogenase